MELGHLLFTIFSAFFGLAVGSFLNVCIYRIPKGTFFTEKHSYCPKCGQPLKWYDMVPVFSWIFLGGKCRNCKEKISARYPIVESLNAVLWTLSAYFIGLNANAFIYDALFSALIVMTFIDIDTKEIPNGIVVFIIILSIPLFFTAKDVVWWHRLVGAVVISVPLYVIALVTGGIGGGDIKLYFALGLVLGLYPTLVSAFIAIVSAGLIGGVLLLTKKVRKGYELPLGPFIALGAVVTVFAGTPIIDGIKNLFGIYYLYIIRRRDAKRSKFRRHPVGERLY